ncbi:MAG: GAF domain-containing sensor histidine kinase [Actinomycetota bacterium]|nr:GAF domain-containing sensor histidine kinase [Actinomycetota bacterium]
MERSDQGPDGSPGAAVTATQDLLQLTLELSGSLDPRTVMRRILERSLVVAAADRATLSSLSGDHLTVEATVGRGGEVTWAGRDFEPGVLVRQAPVVELLATRRTVLAGAFTRAEAEPEFRSALADVRHTALVPILEENRLAGMLVLSRYADTAFLQSDIPSLTAFGALAGLALRNAKQYEEATAAARRVEAAARAAADVAMVQEIPELVERVIAHACAAAGADAGSVMRPDGDEVVIEATSGIAPIGARFPITDEIRLAMETGNVAQADMTGRRPARPESDPYTTEYAHALATPMRFGGELLGLLVLGRHRDRPPFSPSDIAGVQQVAALAALVLHNSRLIQRLRQAETVKRDFMNIAVHELRGPLTIIEGYAGILSIEGSDQHDPDTMRQIGTIRRQAEHARLLVDDLLILARLESDELGAAHQEVDVAALLHDVVGRAVARAQLRSGSIRLDADEDLCAVGDRILTGRIIDNLITNAIEYSGAEPSVTVSGREDETDVVIRVEDEGISIPEDERERIFARFTRGSHAGSVIGSGLGLYLSRECARRMGGELVLENNPGPAGNAFRLTLPATRPR